MPQRKVKVTAHQSWLPSMIITYSQTFACIWHDHGFLTPWHDGL